GPGLAGDLVPRSGGELRAALPAGRARGDPPARRPHRAPSGLEAPGRRAAAGPRSLTPSGGIAIVPAPRSRRGRRARLPRGVTVTQQVLVLSFLVRIQAG